ncbi:hypothetical protein K501DRAFT_219299, partial [Backusella circina FSU 941]
MSDRPKRKRKERARVSNAHYVGYVEDEESVEAIMKKFEELERIQQEFSTKVDIKEDDVVEEEMEEEIAVDEVENKFTQEQLEEVFKRTSSFTVKSATIDTSFVDDLDALDLWQVEYHDNDTNEFYEEDEYTYMDDFFWDEEFGGDNNKKRTGGRQPRIPKEPRGTRKLDRESIIAKYRIMQVQVQDKHGNYFTVKKRVSNVDPSLPTYVKIPARPIPMSWAHKIKPIIRKQHISVPGSRYEVVDSILSTDLSSFGNSFSAIYMDPPLLLPGEKPTRGKISIDDFANLKISNIMKAGFLFIWLEKEWLRQIVAIAAKWGFKYVENFCWIKKDLNNQIHKSKYTYFNKSKLTLLIFRKEGDIELRHQRNPDCVFDYIRPMLPDEVTESKPPFMYHVIETLLPNAIYHPEKNPNNDKLLELWSKKDQRRQGWTTLCE